MAQLDEFDWAKIYKAYDLCGSGLYIGKPILGVCSPLIVHASLCLLLAAFFFGLLFGLTRCCFQLGNNACRRSCEGPSYALVTPSAPPGGLSATS